MTTYYCSDAGDDTTGTSWATAKTTLAGALALCTTDGDGVYIDKDHTGDNAIAADTTWQPPSTNLNCYIICVDKDNSDALATMGTATWIGNSSTYRSVVILPYSSGKLFTYGITLRTAGSSVDHIGLCTPNGGAHYADSVYLWSGNTNSGARIYLGGNPFVSNQRGFLQVKNSTFRFGQTSQKIAPHAKTEIINCSISADGSAITTIFSPASNFYGEINVIGCDFSAASSTANIVESTATSAYSLRLVNCRLPSSYALMSRAAVAPNQSSGEVYLFDCAGGDTHYNFAHADMLGETVIDTGIYISDGVSPDGGTTKTTWKITTTANVSYKSPYYSPWIDRYHSGTSAITPYLEGLRSSASDSAASTTAQDDEVWARWSAKATSGYTNSTVTDDRMVLLGSPADQTSTKTGSDWTGEQTYYSTFKLQAPSMTPAEVGHLRAQVCCAIPSTTIYVDPAIRGTS